MPIEVYITLHYPECLDEIITWMYRGTLDVYAIRFLYGGGR